MFGKTLKVVQKFILFKLLYFYIMVSSDSENHIVLCLLKLKFCTGKLNYVRKYYFWQRNTHVPKQAISILTKSSS